MKCWRGWSRLSLSFISFHIWATMAVAQSFTLVELNCENLFDTRHDEGKEDADFVEGGARYWNRTRYWRKLNHIGQEILSCSTDLPDVVALCEVENDSVVHDLTRRSLLRGAGYDYLMTCSPDVRGVDVALLYQPAMFKVLCYETIEIPLLKIIAYTYYYYESHHIKTLGMPKKLCRKNI